jgi:hypothetical protein
MGIAYMQADGSRVSTFVLLLGYISTLTFHLAMGIASSFCSLLELWLAGTDGMLFFALRQNLPVGATVTLSYFRMTWSPITLSELHSLIESELSDERTPE